MTVGSNISRYGPSMSSRPELALPLLSLSGFRDHFSGRTRLVFSRKAAEPRKK